MNNGGSTTSYHGKDSSSSLLGEHACIHVHVLLTRLMTCKRIHICRLVYIYIPKNVDFKMIK